MKAPTMWPGYPYTMPMPVDYEKVGCPGISIHAGGKIVSESRETQEAMHHMEDMIKALKNLKDKEQWDRQYTARYSAIPGDDVLAQSNKLIGRPKK